MRGRLLALVLKGGQRAGATGDGERGQGVRKSVGVLQRRIVIVRRDRSSLRMLPPTLFMNGIAR